MEDGFFSSLMRKLFPPRSTNVRLPPSPFQPKPAPSTKPKFTLLRGRKQITQAQYESMVASRAALFAAGQPITAHHYQLARQAVARDLASQGMTVMGSGQSKGISEAAAEAGGADKI